jgi:hypothetical protein
VTSERLVALVSAIAGIALTLAQYVVPAWAGFHTWQYTAAQALVCVVLFAYARTARKTDGERGARLAIAAVGALVIAAAGIGSGLLGPDTRTVESAPGTVSPLPDVGVAAFFPIEDAAGIARGDAHVLLRRRDADPIDVGPGVRRYIGATALETVDKLAAYVEAWDDAGSHLTITQPTNAAFLSPVLFFPQTVEIAGKSLASDAFATPALHRQVKTFYFPKDATRTSAAMHGVTGPAVLFAVDDDRGRLLPGGIGFAQSGRDLRLGGMRLRATVGSYPTLEISAIPYPPAVGIGLLVLLGGLVYAAMYAGGRVAGPAPDTSGTDKDQETTARLDIGPKDPVKNFSQTDRTGSPL